RPPKRARPDDYDDAPVVRSDKLWLDDGNLVIQAERTQFRVHRSVLSRHSVFFRDLKDIPQPSHSDEATARGCPVIELQDEAEAVEFMLDCIYDTGRALRKPSYKELLLALRMGHKYLVPVLFDNAAKRMHKAFPTELTAWNADDVYNHFDLHDDADGNYFELLSVARAVGLETVMPALCLHYLNDASVTYIAVCRDRQPIDANDVVMLLLGRHQLVFKQTRYTLRWALNEEYGVCETPKKCDRARSRVRDEAFVRLEANEAEVVLDQIHLFAPWTYDDIGLCRLCSKTAQNLHTAGRKELWEVLPSIFGLGSWVNLHDFRIQQDDRDDE
ncbi:hypothetical protein BD626DRAFT_412807, partial [Schizophyllum amplum]